MAKRKVPAPSSFAGREQSQLKSFLYKMFENGCSPEEALQTLRCRFDAEDFARARALSVKIDASAAVKDLRGPRGKG